VTVIFVAVGTTDFDVLIKKMDEIAPLLSEEVVMQIGNGQYMPQNARYFRFAPTLETYYDDSTLIVAHGGRGITLEVLEKGKKLISVENTTVHGGHQKDLLSPLAEEGYLIWCRDVDALPEALEHAKCHEFKRYVAPECEIHTVIQRFLQEME
jgi:beta-1,4-N-acetylglucosaminyltransferase